MAIFPSDDPGISLTIRNRLRPLIASHSSNFAENVKRNAPSAGASQSRDIWGRTKFQASLEFDRLIDDAELLMSFWEVYRVVGFTFFDFEPCVIGTPGYRNPDPLGTGDGATLTFTVRAKELVSSSIVVYEDTAPSSAARVVISSANYALSVGTGPQGEDQIVFGGGHAPLGAKAVTGATNATPIVVTAVGHGRATGEVVQVAGVLGNTAANGTWTITVTGANTFSLTGSVGNGAYTSGGSVLATVLSIAYKGRRRYTVEIPTPPPKSSSDWNTQKLTLPILEKF